MKTSAALTLAVGTVILLAPAPVAHADQATFLADIAGEGSFSQIPRSALLSQGSRGACTALGGIRVHGPTPGWVEILNGVKADIANADGVSMQDADQFVAIAGRDLCPDGNASGSSGSACNSASCVPNVTQNAVQGGSCVDGARYKFGLDSSGNTLFCGKNGWDQSAPLIGVRVPETPCSTYGVAAQSADGSPMVCDTASHAWAAHYG